MLGTRATVLWSQLVFLPSMLIGGLMVPLDLLPASMLREAALLPSTQAMQAYLGFSYGDPTTLDPPVCLAVLAASALVALGLAIYLFSWDRSGDSHRGHPALALLVLAPAVAASLLG